MRVTVLYSIVGSDQITGSEIFPGGDTVLDKKNFSALATPRHGRKSRGTGTRPPEFRDANANFPHIL